MKAAALCLLLMLTACSSQNSGAQLIGVPEQWAADEVIELTVQWHVVPPDRLPVVCGDTEASGCTVYGDGPACAIAAADPRYWSPTSETGLRRHRTLAHEVMHCAFGSFHD